jgi:phosphoglucosamine mutase
MRLFGTDGIRGDSTIFPFDNRTLNIIGKSIVEVLNSKKLILIVRDTRESGKRIQRELARGILDSGCKPIFGGVMPTPAASLLVQKGNYSTAIVISASHNPYIDNGIKIFNSKGYKLADSVETKIEKKVKEHIKLKTIIQKKKVVVNEKTVLLKFYEKFILGNFTGYFLKGKTIVLDCANGASYKCACYIFKKLGAKVVALNIKPDGKNINLACGALYPQQLANAVKKFRAFCGFAFDGDADRLICVDENGFIRDGDYFLSSMAKWLKSKNRLKNNTLVTTVMANIGFFQAMKREEIKVISSKVGDRYVMEYMRKYKSTFGGEQSGHFIFKDILVAGDGILSAVMILSALCDTNKSMSEFMSVMERFPQVLINKKVYQKVPIDKLLNSCKLIENYERTLGTNGRILVRYSGTENILRIMVEGENSCQVKVIAEDIAVSIEKEIRLIGNRRL